MSFCVTPVDRFKKEAKRLIRKYHSLKQDLQDLSAMLEATPETGKPIGADKYNFRIAIKSKGQGKSGGAGVITYVVTPEKHVYQLIIYDKSELGSLDDKAIRQIIKSLRDPN